MNILEALALAILVLWPGEAPASTSTSAQAIEVPPPSPPVPSRPDPTVAGFMGISPIAQCPSGLVTREDYDQDGDEGNGAELVVIRVREVPLLIVQLAPGVGGKFLGAWVGSRYFGSQKALVEAYPTPCDLLGLPS